MANFLENFKTVLRKIKNKNKPIAIKEIYSFSQQIFIKCVQQFQTLEI